MKKLAIALIALTAVAAFADDAMVLPKGVFRITTAASYVTASESYNTDGDAVDLANDISVLNLGAALEYGVNDFISAAVQWAPGYNVWSEMGDTATKLNGPFDIFAGAKIQIVGAKAPVSSDSLRFAIAPGVKIPIPGADFAEERANLLAGDDYIGANADKHLLGIGGRAYADYVVNKSFYVNLFGEFIYYPIAAAYDEVSLTTYMTALAMGAAAPDEYAFGYDLKLEAEPHADLMLGEGLRMGLGLPITYNMTPAVSIDGTEVADSETSKLSLGPNMSLFFLKSVVPFEVKVAYIFPVMGANTTKANTISLQGKIYLKF